MNPAHPLSASRVACAALLLSACGSSPPLTPAPDGMTDSAGLSDGAPAEDATSGGDDGSDGGAPADTGMSATVTRTFQNGLPELDLLFMIDNSASMAPLQNKLAANFPAFLNALTTPPGMLPSLHLAVVSSSLGAGPSAPSTQCPVDGDHGAFQTAARLANCMTGLPPDQHFLSSINGMNNFTGDLAASFSCIAQLGDQGCGFEHQFASVLRALEPGQPAINQGFLRPSALLAIVLVTNEDDCSAPPDADIFATSSQSVSDPLGPLASYRCNEFGHLCGGMKPPRTPAVLTDCTSAEDGRLLKVADVIARTRALKNDPSQILVAAIAAPPTPYEVTFVPGTTATGVMEQEPEIKHSCTEADGTYGDPAVRIKQWVDAFHGNFVSICETTFEPALSQIANAITAKVASPCIEGRLVDDDPTAPGVQPRCTVTDILVDANGNTTETPIPSCKTTAAAQPCWDTPADQTVCLKAPSTGGTRIVVRRVDAPPAGSSTRVNCQLCDAAGTKPGCGP